MDGSVQPLFPFAAADSEHISTAGLAPISLQEHLGLGPRFGRRHYDSDGDDWVDNDNNDEDDDGGDDDDDDDSHDYDVEAGGRGGNDGHLADLAAALDARVVSKPRPIWEAAHLPGSRTVPREQDVKVTLNRTGDKHNMEFQSIHKGDVPAYWRAAGGFVVGRYGYFWNSFTDGRDGRRAGTRQQRQQRQLVLRYFERPLLTEEPEQVLPAKAPRRRRWDSLEKKVDPPLLFIPLESAAQQLCPDGDAVDSAQTGADLALSFRLGRDSRTVLSRHVLCLSILFLADIVLLAAAP
jgi:hypothetical protein